MGDIIRRVHRHDGDSVEPRGHRLRKLSPTTSANWSAMLTLTQVPLTNKLPTKLRVRLSRERFPLFGTSQSTFHPSLGGSNRSIRRDGEMEERDQQIHAHHLCPHSTG